MLRVFVVFVALFYAVPIAVSADMMSLFKLARDADPAFQSVHYDGKVAEELHNQSTANFLPTVTGQYQAQRTNQKILRSDNAVFAQGKSIFPTTNWTATLTQPVFHADSWFAFSQTKIGIIRSELDFVAAQQDLMVRMVDAYLNALASEEGQVFAVAEYKTLKSELESARVKYANGLTSVSELRDVEARSAEVEAHVVATKAAVRDAREVLRSMVGVSVDQISSLRREASLPGIDAVPVDEKVKQALVDNYTIRSNQAAVSIADKESSRLYAQHLPTVDVIARFNRRDTKGTLFGGGSKVDTGDIILQVDVPIFSGGRMQSQAREAVYRYEQAKQELEAARRSVERDIRSGYATLLSDEEKVSALRHVLKAKRSLYELRREGYKSGLNSIQTKLEAQRDFYSAERDLAAARYDHILNYVKIKQASGQLNPQDLEQINALLTGEQVAVSRLDEDASAQTPSVVALVAPQAEAYEAATASPTIENPTPAIADIDSATENGAVDVAVQPATVVAEQQQAKPGISADTVLEALEHWRQAWVGRNQNQYFGSYAQAFKPQRGSLSNWKRNRLRMLQKFKKIEVILNDVDVQEVVTGSRAKATFLQFFNSEVFRTTRRKTLELIHQDSRWLIVSENLD